MNLNSHNCNFLLEKQNLDKIEKQSWSNNWKMFLCLKIWKNIKKIDKEWVKIYRPRVDEHLNLGSSCAEFLCIEIQKKKKISVTPYQIINHLQVWFGQFNSNYNWKEIIKACLSQQDKCFFISILILKDRILNLYLEKKIFSSEFWKITIIVRYKLIIIPFPPTQFWVYI